MRREVGQVKSLTLFGKGLVFRLLADSGRETRGPKARAWPDAHPLGVLKPFP